MIMNDVENDIELRALDCWISENIFGLRPVHKLWLVKEGTFGIGAEGIPVILKGQNELVSFSPTSNPAAAMMLLEKCCKQAVNVEIWFGSCNWWVSMPNRAFFGNAETLPLAICLFAKKLFTK